MSTPRWGSTARTRPSRPADLRRSVPRTERPSDARLEHARIVVGLFFAIACTVVSRFERCREEGRTSPLAARSDEAGRLLCGFARGRRTVEMTLGCLGAQEGIDLHVGVGPGVAVLEQVAQTLREQACRRPEVDVLERNHDPHARMVLADSCAARMPSCAWSGGMRMLTIATSGRWSSTLAGASAFEDLRRDVDDRRRAQRQRIPAAETRRPRSRPHGSSAVTVVPTPGGLTTRSRPWRASTRSARPGGRSRGIVGAADAVVRDLDARDGAGAPDAHRDVRGLRVLGDVGERLARDEVGGELHGLGQSVARLVVHLGDHGGARRQRVERGTQSVLRAPLGAAHVASSRSSASDSAS